MHCILGIFALLWLICGFLAYGIIKGVFKNILYTNLLPTEYDWGAEGLCLFYFASGPFGLMVALIVTLIGYSITGQRLSFCLFMPRSW
jgi:hypothetical protein